MRRSRKWKFSKQEAGRLAALGLSATQIALRLGVHKSTVCRWIQAGKLIRFTPAKADEPTPPRPRLTPAEWAAAVRADYDLDATDDQLVTLGELALRLSTDSSVPPHVRMNASARFQAIVRQLSLVTRGGEPEIVSPPETTRKKHRLARRPPGDPRTGLLLIKSDG